MKNHQFPKNQPSLRFKNINGQSFSDWQNVTLKDITTRVSRKNNEHNKNVLTISSQYGLISQTEYFNKTVSAANTQKYYLLNNGEFAYNKSYSKGYPMGAIKCLNRYDKGVVSTLYICFKFNDSTQNSFFEQYFASGRQNKELEKVAKEGARNHGLLNIGIDDFFGITLQIPSNEEKKKIAEFLSAIDKKIDLVTEKLNLINNYKIGILQRIFKQEIRFKDDSGNQFPDWELKQLSELLYESKTRNIDLKYFKNDVLSVSGEFGVVNQIEHKGRSFAGESIKNYHVVRVGDIVYTKSPLKANPYGIIKANKRKDGVVSTLYAVYGCKDGVLSTYLDCYFQLHNNVNNYLRPLVNKGAKNDMKINNSHVLTNFISVPVSIQEQEKIVKFISLLDIKISTTKVELELLTQYKQGLLQQMFV